MCPCRCRTTGQRTGERANSDHRPACVARGGFVEIGHCALNAAARLVFSRSKYDHVTPLLQELHWLRIEQRIEFKLSVLVFHCLNGLAPSYLIPRFSTLQTWWLVNVCVRHQRRRSSSLRLSTAGDRAFPVAAARTWNACRHLSQRDLRWRSLGVS